ncbi:MAG: DUF885 domain-containing protein [Chloroflexi bacterium]|nr:DUF885 domain-containing protein [Chloroflexota bacterium]
MTTELDSVSAISDWYVEALAAASPNMATSLGIPGRETELTDYSPDGHEERSAVRRQAEAALRLLNVETERDRVARDVMLERFAYEAELESQQEHLRSLNILASPLQNTRQVFDLMPRETEEDQANIVERMGAVPEALERYRASLVAGMEQGIVVAQRQVRGTVEQCRVWAGKPPSVPTGHLPPQSGGRGEATSFFRQLCDELGIDGGSNATAAEQGYAAMGDWLEREYLPNANPRDPVGRDRYQAASRGFNGIELDLDETYQWGWEEVWRIQSEMAATAERIAPGASTAEAIAILEADDERAIEGEHAFREWMQQTQDETMQALLGAHFDIAEPVQRIEAMIAPPGGALAMYYTGPSEDFSRPGRTWYPTGGATRFPLWRELSVCYHEGVPGHHLQIGTTRYLGDQLTRYQRLLAGTSGYVEGWALYAERLMAELGYLEDPAFYMGLLSSQALRAVRVVIDIGMHLELPIPEREEYHGGETWTPELGLPFLIERSFFPEQMLASEVDRYLGWPGQAISYKVGEREWLAAREAARQSLGDAFDLKSFHKAALDLGPMGLQQLRDEMSRLRG